MGISGSLVESDEQLNILTEEIETGNEIHAPVFVTPKEPFFVLPRGIPFCLRSSPGLMVCLPGSDT